MVLLTSREHLAVEVEAGSTHLVVQIACTSVYLSPLHHVAILSSCHRLENLVSSLHELWLTNHDFLHILALDTLGIHLALNLQVWTQGIELFQRHLVVVGNGVTQFCTRLRHLGQRSLNLQDVLHLLLSNTLLEAIDLEHADDVLFVGLTNLYGSLVILQIVVFLTQCQTTLHEVQNVLRSILLVSTDISTKKFHITIGHHLHLDVEKLLLGLGSL